MILTTEPVQHFKGDLIVIVRVRVCSRGQCCIFVCGLMLVHSTAVLHVHSCSVTKKLWTSSSRRAFSGSSFYFSLSLSSIPRLMLLNCFVRYVPHIELPHEKQNVQPPQESVDSSHPPLSPSRGQTRWAPPPGPRSPRRSRLTWCAGDRQETIEARGGRVPPRDMPDSPPFWSLSDSLSERQRIGGRGREALPEEEACSAGQGTLTSRPRSATEGVAGAGIVVRAGHGSPERDGDRRRRDVFSGGLDSGRR